MNDNGLARRPVVRSDIEGICDRAKLFAILDACEDPPIYEKTKELGPDRALCLHGGDLDEEERQVAPYLVHVDRDLLAWILGEPWGRPWGLFLVADCDGRTLRPHLRKLLIAEEPEGEPIYLRYYDPRVTPTLLESSNREQLEEIMGPARALLVPESEHGQATMYYLA
jgi:hypothetical protein